MKIFLTTLSILLTILISNGQSTDVKVEKKYIEVSGDAEMLVVPDEIYIGVTIRERYEGRDKITLDSIEHLLKIKLTELGIDLKNLSLSDANSDYVKVRWTKKDVLTSKDYTLKVSTASQVSKAFEELSKIKIQELNIDRVNHSKLQEFKKEVKVNAIKAAKEKASYLLIAIGEQVGKTLRVVEQEVGYGEGVGMGDANTWNIRGSRANVIDYSIPAIDKNKLADEISFNKIKIEYQIIGRFEIK